MNDKIRINGAVYQRLDGYASHDVVGIPNHNLLGFKIDIDRWYFDRDDKLVHVITCPLSCDNEEEYFKGLNKVVHTETSCFLNTAAGEYNRFLEQRDFDMPEKASMTEVKSFLGIRSIVEGFPKMALELELINNHPADKYFIKALHEILDCGINTEDLPCSDVRTKWADGTPAHYIYVTNKIYEYDLSEGYFPLISYRPQAWKSAIKEVLWIYQDQSNELKLLQDKHNIHWWNQHESKDLPGTIGQRYGATIKRYDLINKLLKDLSGKGSNRRLVVDMLQFTDINESDGLYPCAYSTTWNVRGEYLDMILNQRSSDFLMAWSINQAQYAALLIMVAKAVGLKPGKFTHVIGNLHIYDRHLEAAKILLERKVDSTSTPTIYFNPFDDNDFYSFGIKDFVLEGYEPNPEQLKLEIAL